MMYTLDNPRVVEGSWHLPQRRRTASERLELEDLSISGTCLVNRKFTYRILLRRLQECSVELYWIALSLISSRTILFTTSVSFSTGSNCCAQHDIFKQWHVLLLYLHGNIFNCRPIFLKLATRPISKHMWN